MRSPIAAFTVATLFVLLAVPVLVVPVAQAAPTEVNVRIEGKTETLFEGPILTDGRNVKAAGDTKAPPQGYRCNGLNNGQNPTAGPTPTAASVDAMSILGEGFDGDWYAEPFEDYFITQWGPERQSTLEAEYWGIVVNNVFTNVGGCQYQVDQGDEVFWIYDAFSGRERLLLYPGDYSGGAVQLTAKATLGVPFEVEVDSWDAYNEGSPPASPTRSTDAFEGAEVAPVVSTVRGFEEVDVDSADTVVTAADGTASITFDEPGWHRIKATVVSGGKETVIRSNRLDVCVPAAPATDCGALPADDQVRVPPPSEPKEPGGEEPKGPGPGGQPPAGGGNPPPAVGDRVKVALGALDRSRLGGGIVGVSWKVRDPGVGIAKWEIAAKALGRKGARFVVRASGKAKTAARVRLPAGLSYKLQITFTDTLGRSSTAALGRVRVPD